MSQDVSCPSSEAVRTAERGEVRRRLDEAATESGDVVSAAESLLFETLATALDPGDAGDSRRILRQLGSCRLPGPKLDRFFARAADESDDAEVCGLSTLLCAQNALFAGDYSEAERRIQAALTASRGSGSRVERVAGLAFARLSLQLRREFEALVLARRAVGQMDAAGDVWGSVMSRLHVCAVYSLIGDMRRLATGLEDVAPRIRDVDPVRRPVAERTYHGRRAEVLQSEGRLEEALESLRALGAVGGRALPGERRWALVLEADILFVLGRFADCDDRLRTAEGLGPSIDARGLRIRTRRLRLDVCRGVATAVDDADALLDDLERRALADVGPAARREFAASVAEALGSAPSALPVARRAYDLAAAAAFERLVEIDRFVRDVPESAAPTFEDLQILEDFRRRTMVAQRETHQAVVRLLASAALEGRSPAPMLPTDGELTCVCAWCQRVRTTDGVWLSIQQFLPLHIEGPIELTHGICEACIPAIRGQIRSETGVFAS